MASKDSVRRKHKEIVEQTHFDQFHSTLNLGDGVVEYLVTKKVLTFDQGDEFLRADPTQPRQYKSGVRNLIRALSQGGEQAYTHFAYALSAKSTTKGNQELGVILTNSAEAVGAPFDFSPIEPFAGNGLTFPMPECGDENQQDLLDPSFVDRRNYIPRRQVDTDHRLRGISSPLQEEGLSYPEVESGNNDDAENAFLQQRETRQKDSFEPMVADTKAGLRYSTQLPLSETSTQGKVSPAPMAVEVMSQFYSAQLLDAKRAYVLSERRCGLAWIFNVSKFSSPDMRERAGSNTDHTLLLQTFPQMRGLLTHSVQGSPTAATMRKQLQDLASSEISVSHDVIVVAILSHGSQASVYGSDGALVRIRDIMEIFSEENAPRLAGKPKVFIVQACHGVVNDSGRGQVELQRKLTKLQDDGTVAHLSQMKALNDMILIYSTLPGHITWQSSTDEPSPFIQTLTTELLLPNRRRGFQEIATAVSEKLARDFPGAPHCAPLNGLRKQLYFH